LEFAPRSCRNCTHRRRHEAPPSMLQARGDPCAAHCRRIRKTAAAWQRAKGRGNFSGNSNRPVSLFTPLFISLLHKTATVPRRGPSSLVWWGPGAVYSTVQPGRRPCAWGRGNAPRTLQNHEYLHFHTPPKPLIFQQFRTFRPILLSVCFISPPPAPHLTLHALVSAYGTSRGAPGPGKCAPGVKTGHPGAQKGHPGAQKRQLRAQKGSPGAQKRVVLGLTRSVVSS
jgi:hypothetical protein